MLASNSHICLNIEKQEPYYYLYVVKPRSVKYTDDLVIIALEDGVVSPDEMKLIRSIFQELEQYKKLFSQAVEDGTITVEEKKILIAKRKEILDSAYQTANDDLMVSKEEFELLQETLNIIYRLELNEVNFQ